MGQEAEEVEMKKTFKPWNLIPYLILSGMAFGGLISWWVILAIFIGNITFQN